MIKQPTTKEINEVKNLFKEFNRTHCSVCHLKKQNTNPISGNSYFWGKERGCCTNCGREHGYSGYYYPKKLVKQLDKKYKFNKKFGYFDNINKRCKLSYAERSLICTNYCCNQRLAAKARNLTQSWPDIRINP